ncbi:MAG: c-type cytochrome [Magnetococcales bacterium]|nr:c-type cytochrome [Magnetococcales bacterium]
MMNNGDAMGNQHLGGMGLWMLACLLAGSAFADGAPEEGDPIRGARLTKSGCGVCHDTSAERIIKVGPPLWGSYGQTVASDPDFNNYTRHLKKRGAEGMTWNETTLDAWIDDPNALVPKTSMRGFRGFKEAQDRADVIAYLITLQDPVAISPMQKQLDEAQISQPAKPEPSADHVPVKVDEPTPVKVDEPTPEVAKPTTERPPATTESQPTTDKPPPDAAEPVTERPPASTEAVEIPKPSPKKRRPPTGG